MLLDQKFPSQEQTLTPPPAWSTDLSATLPPLLKAMYHTFKDTKNCLWLHTVFVIQTIPIRCTQQYADDYLQRTIYASTTVSLDHLVKQQDMPSEEMETLYGSTPEARLERVEQILAAGVRLYENNKRVLLPKILFWAWQDENIATLLIRHYGIYYDDASYHDTHTPHVFGHKIINSRVEEKKLYGEYLEAHHTLYTKSLRKVLDPTILINPKVFVALAIMLYVMPASFSFRALVGAAVIPAVILGSIPGAHSEAFARIAQTMQEGVQEQRRSQQEAVQEGQRSQTPGR